MNKTTMNKLLEQAHQQAPGKLIYLALQGSRLYGTHRLDSDYDLRGVFLPPLIDLLDSRQKDALSLVTAKLPSGVSPFGCAYFTVVTRMPLICILLLRTLRA
jgi:hypothetical protein